MAEMKINTHFNLDDCSKTDCELAEKIAKKLRTIGISARLIWLTWYDVLLISHVFEKAKKEFEEKETMDLRRDSLLGRGISVKKEKDAEVGWFPGDNCD